MKVLILGQTGSGKSFSVFPNEKAGIKGLPPKETMVISCSSKLPPVPLKGMYSKFTGEKGNYLRTNSMITIHKALVALGKRDDIKNIVIDDFQFLMGDYYMTSAGDGKNNFDIFKDIGGYIGKIMVDIDKLSDTGRDIYILSHYEIYDSNNGLTSIKPKTAGKVVDNYLTPEGRTELLLFATVDTDGTNLEWKFLTKPNAQYSNIKTLYGMFDREYIPNDLGLLSEKINEYKKSFEL